MLQILRWCLGLLAICFALTAQASNFSREDWESVTQAARRAAQRGDADGQFILGLIYAKSVASEDHPEAAQWFRKAAEQGHAEARFSLGLMYFTGRGVAQSDAEAVRWFRLAAEQGNLNAQMILGVMSFQGRGVAQSDAEAAQWLRKAAEQGHAEAQLILGQMYREGRGVPQSDAEAAQWFRKAAEHTLSIPDETRLKYQELIDLILACESMFNNIEKQQWIDLLPSMTDEQRNRLRSIMLIERQQLLEARDAKNAEEIRAMNERHLAEWRSFEQENKKTRPEIEAGEK